MTVYSIGKSVENRHLWVTRISTEVDNSRKLLVQKRKQLKPMVKIVANMHGNEVIIGEYTFEIFIADRTMGHFVLKMCKKHFGAD